MNRLQVLKLLRSLITPCRYDVPDTGSYLFEPDYVVDHTTLCCLINQAIADEQKVVAIQEEKSNDE